MKKEVTRKEYSKPNLQEIEVKTEDIMDIMTKSGINKNETNLGFDNEFDLTI